MGRLLAHVLLLGLTLVAHAQGVPNSRPEFAPHEGCIPGARTTTTCPVRMECFIDENYANGGRCDCNPLWFKKPAKLPFDDSEWDDGFTSSDCESHHISRAIASTFYWVLAIMRLCHIYTTTAVTKELFRVKALKRNATTYSLILLLSSSIVAFFVDLIYALNMVDGDKTEFWYMNRTVSYLIAYPANVFIDYEIGVTWIDLYDRTSKMSKSASKNLKALRIALHTIALGQVIGFFVFLSLGDHISLMLSSLVPSVSGLIFVPAGGHLITKTLCPDKDDTSNPNWKVAASIRRAVKHAVIAKFLEITGLVGMGQINRDPIYGYTYNWFHSLFWFGFMIRFWSWIHYLIVGSRKYMKKFSNDDASPYFGFATIELNKALKKLKTRISSKLP